MCADGAECGPDGAVSELGNAVMGEVVSYDDDDTASFGDGDQSEDGKVPAVAD